MIRLFHKYLSLVISIQLLLWTISGIYFAFNKIELVRGEQYLIEQKVSKLNLKEVESSFSGKNVNFIRRLDEWIIKVETDSGFSYTDLQGQNLDELNAEEVREVVRQSTNLIPLMAQRIDKQEIRAEFRGRNLPIFKVATSTTDNINVYVDAFTGEVTAIRSDSWRIWDFLWGAHIIDYSERENINNFLIKILSILALISSLSGIVLFFKTFKFKK
ncbi:MAG: PepSY domain-containing protein [Candidatus Thioglobus sp.]|nr:PepSY domain-containing protein [Candidatus Thioglobus sp.]